MQLFFVEGAVSLSEVRKVQETYSRGSLLSLAEDVEVVDVKSFDGKTYNNIANNLYNRLDFLRYKGSRDDDKEEAIKIVNNDTKDYFYIKCGDSKYPKNVGFEVN